MSRRCRAPRTRQQRARYAGSRRSARCAARPSAARRRSRDEDQVIQSMPDASPTKWHRAHTTWFFEQFLLRAASAGLPRLRRAVRLSCSTPITSRPARGMRGRSAGWSRGRTTQRGRGLSRACRRRGRAAARTKPTTRSSPRSLRILEIGLNHEQQHQELLLTDILHAFAQNPIAPAYDAGWHAAGVEAVGDGIRRRSRPASTASASTATAICFDNERPAHQVLSAAGADRARARHQREWLDFIADGGYATPSLWLSDGWATVQAEGWEAPGYWRKVDGAWHTLTLARPAAGRSGRAGLPCQLLRGRRVRALGRQGPADRSRSGRSRRAPACSTTPSASSGNGRAAPIRPIRAIAPPTARSANTTASSWSTRWCCAARRSRRRPAMRAPSYRNFFYPPARWQFSGLRLADYGD